jgi:diguanylate cyclase (GGDEF)-like protein
VRVKTIYSGILRRYLRLTIRGKMLLGYIPLVVLIVALSAAHVMRLERIMAINEEILEHDIPTAEAAGGMVDSLLSQELYANRFFILGSGEMREAFSLRGAEFKDSLAVLKEKAPPALAASAEPLASLHERYERLFEEEFAARPATPEAQEGFRERVRGVQDEIIGQLKQIEGQARKSQEERTRRMAEMQHSTFTLMLALSGLGVLVGAGAALLITRDIASSISRLRAATAQLAEGRFDELPNLRGQDELGELSWAFYEMGQKLKALEEAKLDSSPLTHLPGGLAIENALRARVEHAAPFAFCLIDVDNFKAFNDRYGYSRGNLVLTHAARIIVEADQQFGDAKDFVGHIGGDDFVVLTLPERYEAVCKEVIARFDATISSLYDPEDRERGYIEGETRQGVKTHFPFASLSIAVVTNQKAALESHIKVSEIAAALKEYAKTIAGSKFIVDRRTHEAGDLSVTGAESR